LPVTRSNSWSARDIKRLTELYPVRPIEELVRLLERSDKAIRSKAKLLRVSKGRRFWSAGELKQLDKLYSDRPTEEIARLLHRTVLAVYQAAQKRGLEKSGKFRRTYGFQKGSTVGAKFRFEKGHAPANKGTRRPGYAPGRMRETQFRKGQRSGKAAELWKPIGTIQPDPEGYLRIKIRERTSYAEEPGWHPNVWPLLSHYVWEKHKGPIPPKHAIWFKDRDRANCAIENLECIPMAEAARRNRMWNILPRELAEAIHANGQLKRKIRNLHGKKQDQRSERPSL
jgi:hypothetical protein